MSIAYDFHLEHISIPKRLYDEMCINHPTLRTKESHRRYLALIAGDKLPYDKRTGLPMFPNEIAGSCLGIDWNKLTYRNYSAIDFLEELKAETFYDLEWTDYNPVTKKCRQLVNTGLLTLLQELACESDEIGKEARVYIVSGLKVTPRKQASNLDKEKQLHSGDVFKYDEQMAIVEYMNDHKQSMFSSVVNDSFSEVWNTAANEVSESTRSYLMGALNGIASNPMPLYGSSRKVLSLCPRSFGSGLACLKKEYRKMFTSDVWTDLDLTNCQLAIAAGIWHIESINDFLRTGVSIWPELMSYLDIPIDMRTSEVKRVVKQALYSIIYGKSISDKRFLSKYTLEYEWLLGVNSQLRLGLQELGIETSKSLSDHYLMRDLVTGVSEAKKAIMKPQMGIGVCGCMGAYKYMMKPSSLDIDSFISYVIQSYELRLIYSVFEIAIAEKESRNSTFNVTLYQHDGISIKVLGDSDSVIEHIQYAVSHTAKQLGIVTSLEVDK